MSLKREIIFDIVIIVSVGGSKIVNQRLKNTSNCNLMFMFNRVEFLFF